MAKSQKPAPAQELPVRGQEEKLKTPVCSPEPPAFSISRGLRMGGQWVHKEIPLAGEGKTWQAVE